MSLSPSASSSSATVAASIATPNAADAPPPPNNIALLQAQPQPQQVRATALNLALSTFSLAVPIPPNALPAPIGNEALQRQLPQVRTGALKLARRTLVFGAPIVVPAIRRRISALPPIAALGMFFFLHLQLTFGIMALFVAAGLNTFPSYWMLDRTKRFLVAAVAISWPVGLVFFGCIMYSVTHSP